MHKSRTQPKPVAQDFNEQGDTLRSGHYSSLPLRYIGKYTRGRKAVGQIRPTELSPSARTLRFVSPPEHRTRSATGCRRSSEGETDASTQRRLGARLISFIAVLVLSRPQIDFYHPEQGLELTCTAATKCRASAEDRLPRRRPKTVMADRAAVACIPVSLDRGALWMLFFPWASILSW